MSTKLTKRERGFLALVARFSEPVRVFPDQRLAASGLESKGFIKLSDSLLHPTATITPAGRAALQDGKPSS